MDEHPLQIHNWEKHNGYHVSFHERAKKAAEARWSRKSESPSIPPSGKERKGKEASIASSMLGASDYKKDTATRMRRKDQIEELTRQIHRLEDRVSTDEERQAHPELVKQLKALKAKRDSLREEVVK